MGIGRNGRKLWRCLQCGLHKKYKENRYSRKFCSLECYEEYNTIECSICKNNFVAIFANQKTCNKCRHHPVPYYSKDKIIERKIECTFCRCKIKTEYVRKKYNTNFINKTGLCEKCKIKIQERRKKQYEENSKRMKKDNPMFREDTKERVSKTLKRKIKNGEILYKRGRKHYLYKGNRGFYADCRKQLYHEWVKKILERDGYECTKCGENNNLQVHHIRPFRMISEIIFVRNKIKNAKNLKKDSHEYWDLIKQIINEHKLCDGITVCIKCHGEIDERYRRYKGKGKKNLPRKVQRKSI